MTTTVTRMTDLTTRNPWDISRKVIAGSAAAIGVSVLTWIVAYGQDLLPLLADEPLLLLLANIAILVAQFGAGYLKRETVADPIE